MPEVHAGAPSGMPRSMPFRTVAGVGDPKQTSPDRRLLRGRQTRDRVLECAVDMASADGLTGLSLARIADRLDLSKSGVSGHFPSQNDLQLAVIGHAAHQYVERIVLPAWQLPAGYGRVKRFCELWLAFMTDAVLAGRCFFLTAMVEYDARAGVVRDELARLRRDWGGLFTGAVREAQRLGEVRGDVDPEQVFFEVYAWVAAAVVDSQLLGELEAFERADRSIATRLDGIRSAPPT